MGCFLCLLAVTVALKLYDDTHRQHSILSNSPVVGHVRYWLETVGPDLRRYIVTGNNEEKPFSRDQRRGALRFLQENQQLFRFRHGPGPGAVIKQSSFPLCDPQPSDDDFDSHCHVPCAKTLDAHRRRTSQFRPQSIVNVSGMSFGWLSNAVVEALNRDATLAPNFTPSGEGCAEPKETLMWIRATAISPTSTCSPRISRLEDMVPREESFSNLLVGCCFRRRITLVVLPHDAVEELSDDGSFPAQVARSRQKRAMALIAKVYCSLLVKLLCIPNTFNTGNAASDQS